ncbi:MAG: flagellar biosynthesis anti-sigma factor FlgM [Aquabacterium sp.]|nr:flagellar biosynthesis anti-sigma factor FlgM [Aquabacterium sp.]
MKIGNPLDKAVGGVSPRTEGGSTTGKTSSATGSVSESAKVTLSNVASGLISAADGSFDADKVSSVKSAIDNGTYQVNPEVIADKLIANAKELLQGKQG